MKIKLGTLRKIIREELKRARVQEIGNIGVVAPTGRHAASALTGWQTPSLETLHKELHGDTEDISTDELIDLMTEQGLELTGLPPRAMGITYALYKNSKGEVMLFGRDVLGNDVFKAVMDPSSPLKYTFKPVNTTPEAMAGRMLAASTR